MLNLIRLTKTLTALILAMGLIVSGVHADMIVTYSYHYTIDLEQKQILLASIMEDAYMTECALRQYFDNVTSVEKDRISSLSFDKIDLAQIVPPSEKIQLAFICNSNMLSPRNEEERLFKRRAKSAE